MFPYLISTSLHILKCDWTTQMGEGQRQRRLRSKRENIRAGDHFVD